MLSPKEVLHIDWYRLFGPISTDFTHISGENFVIYTRTYEGKRESDDYEPMRDTVSKAEFRIGQDGKVKKLGLGLDEEMGDEKVWFTKIE